MSAFAQNEFNECIYSMHLLRLWRYLFALKRWTKQESGQW
jgi:hypothetical protein